MAPHVMAPSVGLTVSKIVQVTLVGIRFTLKGDVPVCIAAHGQPHQPFHQIAQVEEHKQQLTLLGRVNAFMVHQFITQVHPVMDKQHTQQVDGIIALERQY